MSRLPPAKGKMSWLPQAKGKMSRLPPAIDKMSRLPPVKVKMSFSLGEIVQDVPQYEEILFKLSLSLSLSKDLDR